MRRLLIRPGAIGDCILSFPAMEHLKATYMEVWVPGPVVSLVPFADAVRGLASTGLDLVGVGDLKMPAGLRASLQSFDSVVSWYGAGRSEFREALQDTGVRCEFHRALPPEGYGGHATDFFAQQVGAPSGLRPRIPVAGAMRRESIVVQPFSGSAKKNWPLERYRELAMRLPHAVEWTAGPEEDLANAVRFEDLGSLAQWISGGRLYIGNDSGITHLAAAVGVPTVALFGPTDPQVWAPRGENVVVLRANPIAELAVRDVMTAANRLLDSQ